VKAGLLQLGHRADSARDEDRTRDQVVGQLGRENNNSENSKANNRNQ
jgi:hypothetical protein